MSLLTVKDLGRMLNIHPKTIYKWSNEGRIPHMRIKGLIRFDLKEIKNWKEKNGKKNMKFYELLPKFDLSIENYDKMLLKGRSALSKKSGRWNYGIGAIYLRKNRGNKERWYIDYRDETGKRVRKVVPYAQSREEALLELQTDIRKSFDRLHGITGRTQKVRFKDLAEQYLEDYAKVNNLAWKRVESCLKRLKEFFGKHHLRNVSPLMIEKYKQKRLKEGIKPASVNRELSVLKRAFNLAIKWKMADENPVRDVRFLRQSEPRERMLTEEEEKRLLEASTEHLKPVIMIALRTGMRKGEIADLKWEQIDMRHREIEVTKTKSGKKRIIPICEDLYEVFLSMWGENSGSEFVFQYEDPKTGERKRLKYFRRAFESACRRAGIKKLTFHDLRHTFASRLVRAGVDLITVKDLLGHHSVRTTERYTHSGQEQKRKAVRLLSNQTSGIRSEEMVELSPICHKEEGEKFKKPVIH